MIHLAYFSYVYVCCYVMQINYCYCYFKLLKSPERGANESTAAKQANNSYAIIQLID